MAVFFFYKDIAPMELSISPTDYEMAIKFIEKVRTVTFFQKNRFRVLSRVS